MIGKAIPVGTEHATSPVSRSANSKEKEGRSHPVGAVSHTGHQNLEFASLRAFGM